MDLYLIRHTRTQAETGVCYGRLEVPLAPTYVAECTAVAGRLPAPQALWSSPRARCRVLAEAIGERAGVAPKIDERLCELDFGEWEGRRWDTIERDRSERWSAEYWNVAPPGGETYRELHERVGAVLAEILAHDAQQAVLVTHAGPIRAVLARCLPTGPQRYPELELEYGGITLLRAGEAGLRLEYVNG